MNQTTHFSGNSQHPPAGPRTDWAVPAVSPLFPNAMIRQRSKGQSVKLTKGLVLPSPTRVQPPDASNAIPSLAHRLSAPIHLFQNTEAELQPGWPWAARVEGVRVAVLQAEAELERHIDEHRLELAERIETEALEEAAMTQRVAERVADVLSRRIRRRQDMNQVAPRGLRRQRGVFEGEAEDDEIWRLWKRLEPLLQNPPPHSHRRRLAQPFQRASER